MAVHWNLKKLPSAIKFPNFKSYEQFLKTWSLFKTEMAISTESNQTALSFAGTSFFCSIAEAAFSSHTKWCSASVQDVFDAEVQLTPHLNSNPG